MVKLSSDMTATRAWRGTLHAILAAAGERRWAVHTSPTTRSPTATRSRDLSMLRPRIPIKKSVSRPRSESRWKALQYLVELQCASAAHWLCRSCDISHQYFCDCRGVKRLRDSAQAAVTDNTVRRDSAGATS